MPRAGHGRRSSQHHPGNERYLLHHLRYYSSIDAMAAPLSAAPSTTSLYRERELGPPPFPAYQRRSAQPPIKELRGGHRPPPAASGTVAKPLASTSAAAATSGAGYGGSACSVRALGWSIDGRRLASSASDRTIRIWTPERSVDARATSELLGHTDAVEQLSWDPTHPEHLASAAGDRSVKLWDIRTPSAPSSTVATPGPNINIAYHPGGSLVAVGDRNDTVSLIDVRGNKVLGRIRSDGAPPDLSVAGSAWMRNEREEINEFSWTPNGEVFVLGTGGGNVRLLDARDMSLVETEVPADGSQADTSAKASPPPALRWPLLHTIVGHTASVFCLNIDPLGRYLATSSADSTTALWSTDEWFNVSMEGHLTHPPRSVSFSHDGEYLAAGGEDAFISITATAPMSASGIDSPLHKIPVASAVNGLAWHPSRFYLAYAGDDRDGTIRIWGMS